MSRDTEHVVEGPKKARSCGHICKGPARRSKVPLSHRSFLETIYKPSKIKTTTTTAQNMTHKKDYPAR